jgi:ankyrin repeat protein
MTPYLTLIKNEDHHSAQIFVKKGANINHKSESGWNVLIPFITHLDLAKLKAFVEECDRNSTAPLDINLTDSVGRNLLHHAMNTSADSINVSFDFQRYLIEKGIAVNSKDQHKRTPLHYTFYKFNRKQ